jgi:uracil-DNA glycosylase
VSNQQQHSAYLQALYLQGMGIQTWTLRNAPPAVPVEVPQAEQNVAPSVASPPVVNEASSNLLGEMSTASPQTSELGARHNDVPEAAARKSPPRNPAANPTAFDAPPMVDEEPPLPTDDNMPELEMGEVDLSEMHAPVPPAIKVDTLDWPALQTAVADCRACELHQSRKQTVFGTGAKDAQWMIIGEAPDADEEKQAAPFMGPTGLLLDNMLRALGLRREQVFISNVVKCRTPEDRHPQAAEFACCEAFLQRQIALVQPKLILAMGGVAAQSLLKVDTAVGKLRGETHHYASTPLVVTYHPEYLLHKPSEKAKSWADLQFAASVLTGDVVAGESGADR